LSALKLVSEALGILEMSVEDFQEEVKAKRCTAMGIKQADIEAKIQQRTDARANKDWAASDALRDELDSAGIVLMDGVDGKTCWRMRIGEACSD
jgi:cysteinyl-tRNA synthetase